MSISGPYLVSPRSSSGGRYQRVTTMLVYSAALCFGCSPYDSAFEFGSEKGLARPKSAIINTPLLLISKFAAFMSRWRILFCACQKDHQKPNTYRMQIR